MKTKHVTNSRGLSQWLRLEGLALSASILLGLSCSQQVGDSCSSDSECEQTSSQRCDQTLPGGYCTVAGCSAGGCPSEAACVGFRAIVASAEVCRVEESRPRLQRTACMLECSTSSDCREGYQCLTIGDDPWGAVVMENRSVGGVCVPTPPPGAEGPSDYCRASVSTRPSIDQLVEPLDAGYFPPSAAVAERSGPDASAAAQAAPGTVDRADSSAP